jgi:CheY-like chemotaxis protein
MNGTKTILLAEDEDDDVFLMQRAVRKMSGAISLQRVKDGKEAVEYLSGENRFSDRKRYPLPSLILLDIKMPRLNGFDVLEWLKANGTLTHIPVVMVSSSTVKTDLETALGLGARDYLVKPVPFEQLKELFLITEDFLSARAG